MPIHHGKFNRMEVGESKIFSIKSKMTDTGWLFQCWWHSWLLLKGLLPPHPTAHLSGTWIFTEHRRSRTVCWQQLWVSSAKAEMCYSSLRQVSFEWKWCEMVMENAQIEPRVISFLLSCKKSKAVTHWNKSSISIKLSPPLLIIAIYRAAKRLNLRGVSLFWVK